MALNKFDTIQRINRALDARDLATADQLCAQLVSAEPASHEGWLLQSRIRISQGRLAESESALDRAARLNVSDPEVPLALAFLRMRQGRFAEALPLFERTQSRGANTEKVRAARAICLIALKDPKAALESLGTPTTAEGCLAAGKAAFELGDREAAETHLRESIRIGENPAASRQSHQLLARLFDERDDVAGAFEQLAAAKGPTSAAFDATLARIAISTHMHVFNAELFQSKARGSVDTSRPVFIVGMPRSGTTLLEKMIASHPRGAGAGETSALIRQIRSWGNQEPSKAWPHNMNTFTASDFDAVARKYLADTEPFAGQGIARVADKHLQNWLAVGLMALAFPLATIVHIRRDPIDTGLSCYERLPASIMPWSRDLRDVGTMLALTERLMNHWHSVLPGRLVTVEYENLVRQPAQALAPVLAAAGLEWNDACVRPHARGQRPLHEPPPTLAFEQVQRPIYDTSIGRAQRYGTLLDPMREAYDLERARTGVAAG